MHRSHRPRLCAKSANASAITSTSNPESAGIEIVGGVGTRVSTIRLPTSTTRIRGVWCPTSLRIFLPTSIRAELPPLPGANSESHRAPRLIRGRRSGSVRVIPEMSLSGGV